MTDLRDVDVLRYEWTGSLVRVMDFRITSGLGEDVGHVGEVSRRGWRRWLWLGRLDTLARHEAVMTAADRPVLWLIRPPMSWQSRFEILDAAKREVARAIQRGGFFPQRFDVLTPTGEPLAVIQSGGIGSFNLRTSIDTSVATLTIVSPRPPTVPFRRPPTYELRFHGAETDELRLVGFAMAPGIHSILFPRL